MDKGAVVFDNYNKYIENCYDKLFTEGKVKDPLKVSQEYMDGLLREWEGSWTDTPLNELGGMSPRDYFDSAASLDELMELFEAGARYCDDKLPDLLLERLKLHGEEAFERLVALATDMIRVDSETDFYIPLMALEVIGMWRLRNAVSPLLDMMFKCSGENELILDAASSALVEIGQPSIEAIIEVIQEAENIMTVHEYLLSSLVSIGNEYKSDDIYRCIKNAFPKMEDKVLGAAFLGDYGDGRAVPFLRGYVEKNIKTMDRETFYEIQSTIIHLGGNMEGIQTPSFD